MKQKISYNSIASGSAIAFLAIFIAIFVLCLVFFNKPFDTVFYWIFIGLFCVGMLWFFCATPTSIYDDDDSLIEKSTFNTRKYRYSDIKSAKKATAEEYSAYDKKKHLHGKYRNPVLITMKDGSSVVVGSENPDQLADYINKKVS